MPRVKKPKQPAGGDAAAPEEAVEDTTVALSASHTQPATATAAAASTDSHVTPTSPASPSAATAPASKVSSPHAQPAGSEPSMTLVLRTKTALQFRDVTRGSDGNAMASTVLGQPIEGGDFSECEPVFTADGSVLACSNSKGVFLVSTATAQPFAVIEEPNITHLLFSPSGSTLVTYRLQDPKNPTEGNMAFWRMTKEEPRHRLELRCGQSTWPGVWWTTDESHFVRRAQGHLMQVHDGLLAKREPIATVDLQTPRGKEPVLATAPTELPFIAVFVPQIKSTLGYCKIFRLPNVKDELLSRNFGNADDADLQWSPYFNAVLVLCRGEGDKTGGSYYGRTNLTVMNVKDRQCYSVVVGKDDGIHDCKWSPSGEEFIVVHGQMPRNRATLFNAQAQPIHSFGESPRNYVQWSPDGRMFILGGNGNLAGETQFYHRESVGKKGDGKLGFFSEKTSVTLWTPDSRSVVSANIFSRLRLDNKFTIWKHTGAKGYTEKFDQLYTATFVPTPAKAFKPRAPSPVVQSHEVAKPQAYRAPGAPSAAAALLARQPASAIGNAVRPATAGPIGATVVVEKKKGRR
jgi:translation initiation factor 2A